MALVIYVQDKSALCLTLGNVLACFFLSTFE